MAEPPANDYRVVITTVLDTLALLAVSGGVVLALLPRIGWGAVGVGGAVLYACTHLDVLADAWRLVARPVRVRVRRWQVARKARRVERAAHVARKARVTAAAAGKAAA